MNRDQSFTKFLLLMANLRWHTRAALAMWLTSIIVTSAASTSLAPPIAQESERSQMHRVLLIPLNLRGRAPVAVDRKQIMEALYGANNSVASRYRAVSFGKVQFAGSDSDLVDPIMLSEPSDFCGTGLGLLGAEAEEELGRYGIRQAAYQHIAFLIPKDAPCWWTGVGDVRGSRVWVKATTVKALQHELGHNLGMNHALEWQSSNPDSSDFMGSGDGTAYNDGPMIVQQLSHSEGRHVTFRISFTDAGQAMSAGPPPAPPGTLQSLASEKCLDLPGGQTTDGTPAIQYDCHGRQNQQWRVEYAGDAGYRVVSGLSSKCIGMDADATAGGQIVQSQCRSSPDQLWVLKRDGNKLAFQNVANRLCLDLPGASLDNGAKLIAWACNGGINQTWRYMSATAL